MSVIASLQRQAACPVLGLENIGVEDDPRFDVAHVHIIAGSGDMGAGELIVLAGAGSRHCLAPFGTTNYRMDRSKTLGVLSKREVSKASSEWIEPTDYRESRTLGLRDGGDRR